MAHLELLKQERLVPDMGALDTAHRWGVTLDILWLVIELLAEW